MGYDLRPRNKKVKGICIGAFSWPIILQVSGAGYVIGYGEGRTPASYVYQPDKRGASPVSNDGYYISSEEAKMMSVIIRGFLSVCRFVNKEWEAMPEDQRLHDQNYRTLEGKLLYKQPYHEDRLKQFEQFADFAEKSKGFYVD